ncbi:hypothetical protein N0V84_002386, partial [Fusarium piperis]
EKENFAELISIDLSLLDSDDPAVVDNLIKQVKGAIREDGFLKGHQGGVQGSAHAWTYRLRPDDDAVLGAHLVSSDLRSGCPKCP